MKFIRSLHHIVRGPVLLVGWTQKIVDGLDGIERSDGHFNESCIPITHGTIPKAWKFHRAEFLAVA